MNWNQFQYVLTISKEKSITRAAQKLYISQPSLSLSLKSLEQELGIELFERKKGEMIPTYAGKLFCDWASSVLYSRQQLSDKFADISQDLRHNLRIGISPHRSSIILPDILEEFYRESGNCDIQIVEEPTYILRQLLEEGDLDLIVDVPHPDALNYQSEVLAEEKIMLAVPEKMAEEIPEELVSFRKVDNEEKAFIEISERLELPFILLTEKQVLGKIGRRILSDCSFLPKTAITCYNVETALILAGRGMGAAFAPDVFSKPDFSVSGIRFFFIEGYNETRKICLIYRKNQYQNKNLKRMQDIFRKQVPEKYNKKR